MWEAWLFVVVSPAGWWRLIVAHGAARFVQLRVFRQRPLDLAGGEPSKRILRVFGEFFRHSPRETTRSLQVPHVGFTILLKFPASAPALIACRCTSLFTLPKFQDNLSMSSFALFTRWSLALALVLGLVVTTSSLRAEDDAAADPAKADADFAFQGEYMGTLKTDEGDVTVGLQLIAMGKGKFRAVGYKGGLPGEGWDQNEKVEADGELKDGKVVVEHDLAKAVIGDGEATIYAPGEVKVGTIKKVERKSPTLGAAAPEGAVVLFDGKNADAFEGGKVTSEGLLMQGVTSKQKFDSFKLHIEFRLPYMPEARGQGRGNSGIYLQGRYEVQMLDSFGLAGLDNECGGIYTIRKPDVNMCLPPLAWQTYDIDFTAAKYDAEGKLTAKPRVTVRHNGQLIHSDVELPADMNTRAAPVAAGKDPGPIYLQNHGNPVRYRNIWVVETK